MRQPEGVISVALSVGVVAVMAGRVVLEDRQLPPDPPLASKREPLSDEEARFARAAALAFAAHRGGNLDESIARYRALLQEEPSHVQIRFNLAHALMTRGDPAQALMEFERVLSLDPSRSSAHLHIATCARALGDLQLAERHQTWWEKSQRRHPR